LDLNDQAIINIGSSKKLSNITAKPKTMTELEFNQKLKMETSEDGGVIP